MKASPNEKEPAVSSYRPQPDYAVKETVSFPSPSVQGKDQKDFDGKALQSLGARVFDWLALEATHRGKSWDRKRLAHVAWIRTNVGQNTRVLHWVRFLWYGRGVLRLTNKSGLSLPRSFWHRSRPEASAWFELSLLPEELLGMDPQKFFEFVEWHNDPKGRPQSVVKLPLDFVPRYNEDRYAWTKAAWERYEREGAK